jgi:hypothetical protein
LKAGWEQLDQRCVKLHQWSGGTANSERYRVDSWWRPSMPASPDTCEGKGEALRYVRTCRRLSAPCTSASFGITLSWPPPPAPGVDQRGVHASLKSNSDFNLGPLKSNRDFNRAAHQVMPSRSWACALAPVSVLRRIHPLYPSAPPSLAASVAARRLAQDRDGRRERGCKIAGAGEMDGERGGVR